MENSLVGSDSDIKMWIGMLLFVFYLIGAVGSIKILQHLKKSNFKERPINGLIFFDEVVYFVLMTYNTANVLTIFVAQMNPAELLLLYFGLQVDEKAYCKSYFLVASFMVIHMSVSRLAMAFVRLLYVKTPNLIKFKLGEGPAAALTGLAAALMTSHMTSMFGSGEAKTRAAFNLCMNQSSTSEFYQGLPESTEWMRLVPIVGMIVQLSEVIIYLLIYQDIAGHDKAMFSLSIISKDAFIKRQSKNSFTLASQVVCFLAESLFTFHHIVLNSLGGNFASKEVSFLLRIPQFAFLTLVKIATSRDLRESLLRSITLQRWSPRSMWSE